MGVSGRVTPQSVVAVEIANYEERNDLICLTSVGVGKFIMSFTLLELGEMPLKSMV